jgi:hypothetical protein
LHKAYMHILFNIPSCIYAYICYNRTIERSGTLAIVYKPNTEIAYKSGTV